MPTIAQSREQANTHLTKYCADLGFDPEWITTKKWETTIDIACDGNFGLEDAERTIQQDMLDIAGGVAKSKRKLALTADTDNLLDTITGDPELNETLAHTALKLCADAYVGGERVNLALGLGGKKKMSPTNYDALRALWTEIATYAGGAGVFTEFVSHPPQDKAALGKGNVGATLDTRQVQGNLLVKINGVRFNVHVDVAG
ncbi:hypothetical protein [Streptomyces geranii]|uniref:hypothetical protein n=1 Tax=Streptomyces geranii TaxID=2058923 RepID=UPI000D037783|nr:hypothetical protein [Streptomyces geranii]